MPTVSIIKCGSYNYKDVEFAIRKAIENIGGTEKFFKKDQKILIKPNILSAKSPEKAVTTHPEVIRAIIRIVRSVGAIPAVGESPGGAVSGAERFWDKCGIKKVCEEENCEMLFFENTGTVRVQSKNPKNKTLKTLEIAKPCLEYDCVITVPKFKTHNLVFLTGAVKNLYGCIPGLRKSMYHKYAPHPTDFSEILVDILAIVKPKLSIMDAIVGMEGEGPAAGKVRDIGLIMASDDAVAMDTVMCEIANFNIKKMYYLLSASKLGLGCSDIQKIKIEGEKLEDVIIKNFNVPPNLLVYMVPKKFAKFLGKFVSALPVMNKNKCTKCMTCIKACSMKAIELRDIPKVDKTKCILCLCCNELCPENAVEIRYSALIRVLLFLRKIKRFIPL
ncbi:MAG: hypothetical protein A2539_04350 [Elusimicrobia bacterium RIFOXYD2_FULL_34_15]|nr:MAG: hypothetical protein A2539_04350 [Elusimicrobia bacterium RIFOXYD2_FULL_34_15]